MPTKLGTRHFCAARSNRSKVHRPDTMEAEKGTASHLQSAVLGLTLGLATDLTAVDLTMGSVVANYT